MSDPKRAPLAPLHHVTLGSNVGDSSSSLASGSMPTPARKLAPIFLRQRRAPRLSLPSDLAASAAQEDREVGPCKGKRRRLSSPVRGRHPLSEVAGAENVPPVQEEEENGQVELCRKRDRVPSIPSYFAATQLRTSQNVKQEVAGAEAPDERMEVEEVESTVWRRRRARLGVHGMRADVLSRRDPYCFGIPQTPYLRTLVHHTSSLSPSLCPSVVLLPSYQSPTGAEREFAPPMAVAFSKSAKTFTAAEAAGASQRRMLAIANEEGGIQLLNVDEPMGMHRQGMGVWFRGHTNAVFDMTWSADDKYLLSASGDQSSRIHALDGAAPRLIASLKGHTSTPKTVTFFDPSRSASLDQHDQRSSIVASAGRDGDILIFDLRCPGHATQGSSSTEPRWRDEVPFHARGAPGFTASTGGDVLNPVMMIKAAHGDGWRRPAGSRTAVKSVTTLAALQAMPGVLASGGSSDGIVKLWDLRFASGPSRSTRNRSSASPLGQLPDPTLCAPGARRSRSVNSLVESPLTGDLYALCGDSKVHTLRPSAYHDASTASASPEAIRPGVYTDPALLVNSFYIRLALSPCGRYLSSGSARGGVASWAVDTRETGGGGGGGSEAVRLRMGMGGSAWAAGREREMGAVDWGRDVLAACADDLATRIWRADPERAKAIGEDPKGENEGWLGCF